MPKLDSTQQRPRQPRVRGLTEVCEADVDWFDRNAQHGEHRTFRARYTTAPELIGLMRDGAAIPRNAVAMVTAVFFTGAGGEPPEDMVIRVHAPLMQSPRSPGDLGEEEAGALFRSILEGGWVDGNERALREYANFFDLEGDGSGE